MLIKYLIEIIVLIIALAIELIPVALIALIAIAIIKRSKANKQSKKEQDNSYDGNRKWYPTGWTFNDQTGLWEPPDYLSKKTQPNKEKYEKFRERKAPTFEEWKAAQEQGRAPEENTSSAYSYKASELPKDEAKVPPKQQAQPTDPIKPEKPKSEYQSAYRAAPVLTANESHNYKVLKAAADKKGYSISIKMRLADLVTPTASRYDTKEYMSQFGKIKSKHVDFVVFDQYMQPKVIIELDDNSHDRKDRQERDRFVDKILTGAGYKIIHTRYINPDILDGI